MSLDTVDPPFGPHCKHTSQRSHMRCGQPPTGPRPACPKPKARQQRPSFSSSLDSSGPVETYPRTTHHTPHSGDGGWAAGAPASLEPSWWRQCLPLPPRDFEKSKKADRYPGRPGKAQHGPATASDPLSRVMRDPIRSQPREAARPRGRQPAERRFELPPRWPRWLIGGIERAGRGGVGGETEIRTVAAQCKLLGVAWRGAARFVSRWAQL